MSGAPFSALRAQGHFPSHRGLLPVLTAHLAASSSTRPRDPVRIPRAVGGPLQALRQAGFRNQREVPKRQRQKGRGPREPQRRAEWRGDRRPWVTGMGEVEGRKESCREGMQVRVALGLLPTVVPDPAQRTLLPPPQQPLPGDWVEHWGSICPPPEARLGNEYWMPGGGGLRGLTGAPWLPSLCCLGLGSDDSWSSGSRRAP